MIRSPREVASIVHVRFLSQFILRFLNDVDGLSRHSSHFRPVLELLYFLQVLFFIFLCSTNGFAGIPTIFPRLIYIWDWIAAPGWMHASEDSECLLTLNVFWSSGHQHSNYTLFGDSAWTPVALLHNMFLFLSSFLTPRYWLLFLSQLFIKHFYIFSRKKRPINISLPYLWYCFFLSLSFLIIIKHNNSTSHKVVKIKRIINAGKLFYILPGT